MVTALQCYMCIASTTSDCYKGELSSLVRQTCRHQSNPERPIETLCVEYSYLDSDQEIVTRGCGYIFEGVNICQYLNLTVPIKTCDFCKSDLCNFNPILSLN